MTTKTRLAMTGLGVLLSSLALVSPALAAAPPATSADDFKTATTDADRAATMRATSVTSDAQDDFIRTIGPLAQQVHAEYDIPASTTAAQAALESGWGSSGASKNDNNYFGVKCTSSDNPGPIATSCRYHSTSENCSNGCGGSMAWFRVYASLQDSLRDYARLLTTAAPYRDALPYREDPDEFIRHVAPHYATDPQYVQKIMTIMSSHNLYSLDTGTAPGASMGDEGIAASASYRFGTQEHLFFRGDDGSLRHTYNNGEEIGTETVLADGENAGLAGEPVAFVAGQQQHVFALLSGNRLGHWFWNPTDSDPTFEVAATDIAGNPTGYAFADQLHALARGTDGKLKHLYWTPDNEDVVEETLEQDIAGDPVAYVAGDQQHVFARTPSGLLGHWYWLTTDNDPHYGTWGTTTIAGNPVGYAYDGAQHVFARGTDGTLKHFYWTLDSDVVEEPLGDPIQGDPIAYVRDTQQHVFVRTPENTVGHLYWTLEDDEPQRENWAGNLGTNPTGFSTGSQLNVYGRSTDGTVTHWYLNDDMDNPDVEAWGE